jgi:hypothetical protein
MSIQELETAIKKLIYKRISVNPTTWLARLPCEQIWDQQIENDLWTWKA